MLNMLGKVIVRPVYDPPELTPSEREEEFNVCRCFGIEGEFLRGMVLAASCFPLSYRGTAASFYKNLPIIKPLKVRIRLTEKFQFHLFKFPGTEREIPRRNLVTEALPIWATPGGSFSRGALDICKIDKIPCAVSGRRYSSFFESSVTPWNVLNIRLNFRISVKFVPPQAGHLI